MFAGRANPATTRARWRASASASRRSLPSSGAVDFPQLNVNVRGHLGWSRTVPLAGQSSTSRPWSPSRRTSGNGVRRQARSGPEIAPVQACVAGAKRRRRCRRSLPRRSEWRSLHCDSRSVRAVPTGPAKDRGGDRPRPHASGTGRPGSGVGAGSGSASADAIAPVVSGDAALVPSPGASTISLAAGERRIDGGQRRRRRGAGRRQQWWHRRCGQLCRPRPSSVAHRGRNRGDPRRQSAW